MRILNRIVRFTDEGIQFEPDQRHADAIVESMNLWGHETKGVTTPGEEHLKHLNGT